MPSPALPKYGKLVRQCGQYSLPDKPIIVEARADETGDVGVAILGN
jgi:hypothetical protein